MNTDDARMVKDWKKLSTAEFIDKHKHSGWRAARLAIAAGCEEEVRACLKELEKRT